jgi:hypothetical protein
LQEFHNAAFFEGIELTARPFKRAKNQRLCAPEASQGAYGATKPPDSVEKLCPEHDFDCRDYPLLC